MISCNNIDATANPQFIFGDYFAGKQAAGTILFNPVTGGTFGEAMTALMGADLIP
jgi:hypothetical protein